MIATLLLLALAPATAADAASAAPAPTCAQGPTTVGDTTLGTPCDDYIVAAPGVALVRGGGGDDTIVPAPITASNPCPEGCHLGVGSQTYEGGPGNDIVFGDRGNDILRGGEGNDRLYGGIGDDLLEGGPDDDLLSGGFGADGINGGSGGDFVRGDGTQDEIVDTGPGTDIDTLSYGTGIAPGFTRTVSNPGFPGKGGERGVYLDLSANLGDNGVAPNGGGVDDVAGEDFERIVGSPFSDYIVGSKGGQSIFGGGGGDVLIAGGSATGLRGGPDGDDCVGGEPATGCESTLEGGPVVPRNTANVSVGAMASGEGGFTDLYLIGSELTDKVTVAYTAAPAEAVTFQLVSGSFEAVEAAESVCEVKAATEAVCEPTAPLDVVLVAGMGENDVLQASGLPMTTSLMLLGGEGNDQVGAGDESDDTLVDGPGDDVLHGHSHDDALLNNGGRDELFGEGGNDLFLSTAICEGDVIDGGEERDNGSWAKFGKAVEARLDQGLAGQPGAGGAAQCSSGTPDSLRAIEDLEGTSSGDVFFGDAGPNQLLGHFGPDTYFALAGEDRILANSGDFDPTIDCGDDVDTAIIDHPQYGDVAAADCEDVFEADPNNFRTLTRLPRAIAPAPPPPADTRPPRTRITAHPPKLIETRRPPRRVVFRFASSEPGSHFRCRLDGRPFRSCASPRVYFVGPGRHAVRIFAIDAAGNRDRTPALFRFRVLRP
ncbi:MAG: calcium-binding protein [Solirubrobacterales bacterium]